MRKFVASFTFFISFIIFISSVLFLSACGHPNALKNQAYVFGTLVEVIITENNEQNAQQAMNLVLEEFDKLNDQFHAWNDTSELSLVNKFISKNSGDTNKKIAISKQLAEIILQSQQISQQNDYIFDAGIGKLIELWGFQQDDFENNKVPTKQQIQQFLDTKPSIKNIIISQDNNDKNNYYLTSNNAEVALDFGGYLKGLALDNAAKILQQNNIKNALINIGGNVYALGNKFGNAWKIGIRHPRESGPIALLELNDNEALGTSGDYQRFFEENNIRYSHLLNPKTGYPANQTQSLTILTNQQTLNSEINKNLSIGLLSDVYSKPLFIAGDNWISIAKKLNLKYVLRVNSNGEIEITEDFYKRIKFVDENKLKIKIIKLN